MRLPFSVEKRCDTVRNSPLGNGVGPGTHGEEAAVLDDPVDGDSAVVTGSLAVID